MIRLSGLFFFSLFQLAAAIDSLTAAPIPTKVTMTTGSFSEREAAMVVVAQDEGLLRRADHKVGEPQLENLSIWKECCSEHDCVAQDVQTIRKEKNGNIAVRIEGIPTEVSKEKFSPVPSQRTWVCYVNPNGEIKNENIRCILYPQTGGTTDAPQSPHSKTAGNTGPQPAK